MDKDTLDRRGFLAAIGGVALAAPRLVGTLLAARESTTRWKSLQRVIDRYVGDGKLVGAAMAVSYGKRPTAYLAAGKLALDSRAPFDEESICRIYSMTKPVTGLAAMILMDRRRLALDQPVADVLPEFRSLRVALDLENGMDSRPAQRTMTMRHLLTHTSGLSYWTAASGEGALPKAYRQRGITPGDYRVHTNRPGFGRQVKDLTEMVERVAELPLSHEPGTAFNYSIGADVMGLVIERVTGKNLDVFFREAILDPLEMHSTAFHVAAKNAARLTTNYEVTPTGLQPIDPRETSVWLEPPALRAGGAGLVSTARDFARFGAMYLGGGALGRVRVIKTETARLALSNLLPPGVVYVNGGGFGAGARLVLPGSDPRFGPAGRFGWGGAAGTDWWIDLPRRGNVVSMPQFMPPTAYPMRNEITAALETDLAAP